MAAAERRKPGAQDDRGRRVPQRRRGHQRQRTKRRPPPTPSPMCGCPRGCERLSNGWSM
jgi:hypothetical protein